MNLDATDVKILKVLQNNARVSLSDLSRQVNLSLSAVSERLRKLENSGIIEQYTTIIKPEAMEKELSVLMMVSLENTAGNTMKDLQVFVESTDEILECHHITGEYDYALKITTHNTDTLEKMMSSIKSINGVRHCQTNVILSSIKKRYSVSPVAGK